MNLEKTENLWENDLDKQIYLQNLTNTIKRTKRKALSIFEIRNTWENFKEIFIKHWIKDFYDFYFLPISIFREILAEDESLLNFYYDVTWERISKISYKSFVCFAEQIWFEKESSDSLQKYVVEFLKENGINYKNSFFEKSELIKKISKDKRLKYFFLKYSEKNWLKDISIEKFREIFWKLWIENPDPDELRIYVKTFLFEKGIKTIQDIEKFTIREIWQFFKDEKVKLFFSLKWVTRSSFLKDELIKCWAEIWLEDKKYKINDARKYLNKNKITDFNSLINYWTVNEVRDLLWDNDACIEILNSLGLAYLGDFRKEHIKRFARKVWFTVPEQKEYSEEEVKNFILETLESEQVTDYYSFLLYWVKKFKKETFKKSNLPNNLYDAVNKYIKKISWKIIPLLEQKDLEKIWRKIWLVEILEEKQKQRFLELFNIYKLKDVNLRSSKIRKNTDLWKHTCTNYVMEKAIGKRYSRYFNEDSLTNLRAYFWISEKDLTYLEK